MSADRPRCDTCQFYQSRDIDADAVTRARAAGIAVAEGECRFFPQVVQKRPSDWCGQYQAGEAE